MKKIHITILIILVAVFFRFFRLTTSPPALNWDEASIGYNAYSILKTGRDEWGNLMPISFRAFGEQKLPGMIYASVPLISIFGLNEFGLRSTSALIGLLSVFVIYLLSKKLFNSNKLALISATLMALSPWAIHFSRVSFEANLALLLTLLSIYFLSGANSQPMNYWWSGLFATLSLYTYNSSRILFPLLLLAYFFNRVIKISPKTKTTLIRVAIVGFILCLPILRDLSTEEGRVRWGTLSIGSQKSFLDDIASSRGYTTLPSVLPRLIHNKATHYTFKLANNYIKTFSTEFLFLSGSSNTQRSVQEMGLLYLFELPLLVIGLFELIKNKRKYKNSSRLILPWLLLAPISSAITIDAPSSVRTLSMLPALLLIESIGASIVLTWLKQKSIFIRSIFLIFVIWSISYFAFKLWYVYPVKYADDWQYGYKQAMQYAYSHYDEVETIYFTSRYGEPHIYALFYGQFDPAKYHKLDIKYSVDPLGWIHVDSFDKFIFTQFTGLQTPDEIVNRTSGKSLLVTGFANLPGTMPRDFELRAPNWKVMFEGVTVLGEQP